MLAVLNKRWGGLPEDELAVKHRMWSDWCVVHLLGNGLSYDGILHPPPSFSPVTTLNEKWTFCSFPSVFSAALLRLIQPLNLVFDNPFTFHSAFHMRWIHGSKIRFIYILRRRWSRWIVAITHIFSYCHPANIVSPPWSVSPPINGW